jgi:hypothetical protein
MSDIFWDPFDYLIVAWLLIAAPAHGLLFAQVPERLGLRPMRWTEGVKYGFAFFGAIMLLFYFAMSIVQEFWIKDEVAIPLTVLSSALPTIALFAWEYRREFKISFSQAFMLAFIQAFILLAMVGFLFGAELLVETVL